MSNIEKLVPLEIELKKADALGGKIALVVMPESYAQKVLAAKREMDMAVSFKDYQIVVMYGVSSDDASSIFLSIPKGIAIYPKDGSSVRELFGVALGRLRSVASSPWIRRLWDNLTETGQVRKSESPEGRFIKTSFYQFYAAILTRPQEVGQVLSSMEPAEQLWIKDLFAHGEVPLVPGSVDFVSDEIGRLMNEWDYDRKMDEKFARGVATLRRFRNVENLVTLPPIARKIMELAGDPTVSAKEVSAIIQHDPVLTSRLLKIVNSAFYGFHRQINSVEHAVVILGNDEVMNLAFTIAISKAIDRMKSRETRDLWEHSLVVANLSQWLAPYLGSKGDEMLYTVGLLHDLGKIVLLQMESGYQYVPGYSTMESLADEELMIGLSHAEVGAFIGERWNLPTGIVDGLKNHHLPVKASEGPLAAIVNLADFIAHHGYYKKDKINNVVVRLLESRGVEMPEFEVVKAYENTVTRVKLMMDIL